MAHAKCRTCGKIFYCRPSRLKKRKYCSRKCQPLNGQDNPCWRGGKIREKSGYVLIHKPSHPAARKDKYVREHVLIAEAVLGRRLPDGTIVHHYNGYDDANKAKLVICPDQSYHQILHARAIALKACGHANWRKCKYCHQYDLRENLYIPPNGRYAFHRECNTENQHMRRKAKRIECTKKAV